MKNKIILPLSITLLTLQCSPGRADDRTINPSGTSSRVSLTYSIEVSRDGKQAKPNTRPVEGDQIKFHVQPNVDGFMYVIASTAGSGEYDVLFPARGTKESNVVRRGKEYSFPPKGIAVGGNNGARSVRMILSKSRLEADPSMLMSRSIGVGNVFIESLGLTRPPSSVVISGEPPEGFEEDEGAVTVEVPSLNDERRLELELTFDKQGNTTSATDPSKPLLAMASVDPTNGPIKNRWALLVGITDFRDKSWNLMYPAKDVGDLSNILLSACQFKSDHVTTLRNHAATRSGILEQLGTLAQKANNGDVVLVYLATRATSVTDNESTDKFLFTSETAPDDVSAGSITEADLAGALKKFSKNVRVILVLDTNHFGSPGRQTRLNTKKLAEETGQMVISTCSPDQTSHASLQYQNGIFFKQFAEALKRNEGLKGALESAATKIDQESVKDYYSHQSPEVRPPAWKWESLKLGADGG